MGVERWKAPSDDPRPRAAATPPASLTAPVANDLAFPWLDLWLMQ